jgi:2-haloacid dehalogenase
MNKWITFDCYGTLVDWKTGMQHALEIVQPGQGLALMQLHRRIEGEIERNEPYRPYREVLAESLRRMAAALGLSLAAGDEHILAATLPFWPLYPDTNAALIELKAQGWKLAILSNVDRDLIQGTLRHFDVVFDLVITAQDVSSYKPADLHAKRFLELSRVDVRDWLYAAVNHEYDLIPGRALGAGCVWINRDAETTDDDGFLVGNLSGMAQLPEVARRQSTQGATHENR